MTPRKKSLSRWRNPAIWIASLTPVVSALIGLAAISGAGVDHSTGQPNLTAAIVNNDQLSLSDPTLGTSGLAGRVLVGELVNSEKTGFTWDITNAATAEAGLRNGTYAAVVTIPDNFTDAYISSTTDKPVQAVLSVETDGSQSYVAALLARALATNLHNTISSALTQTFVDTLLVSFTGIGEGLAAIGDGATALEQGLDDMTQLSRVLPGVTSDLASGSRVVTNGVYALGDALWSLGTYNNQAIESSGSLASNIDLLRTYVTNQLPASATKTEILAQLSALELTTDALILQQAATGVAIDTGALAADVIGSGSNLLTEGTRALSDGLPLFTEGLSAATSGAGVLAEGLNDASSALPRYTSEQAAQLAQVVAQPVKTDLTTSPPLPSAVAAISAFTVPVALWLGALAISLVVPTRNRRAALSQASTSRLVLSSLLPAVVIAAIQVVFLGIAALVMGVNVVHHLNVLFIATISAVCFVLLHQGFTALLGRAAWALSLGFLGLQIIAAGVIVPPSFLPDWVSASGDVLPLSQTILAFQRLLTGGQLTDVTSSIITVTLTAALGLVVCVVAHMRLRRVNAADTEVSIF